VPGQSLCKACVSRGVLLGREQGVPTEGVRSHWDHFTWTFQTSQGGRVLGGYVVVLGADDLG